MSDPDEWKGAAGGEVQKCIIAAQRAKDAVEQASRDLQSAQNKMETAERGLDIAKRVYFASQQDIERRIRLPRVTQQKREWLKALAIHDVFGASEMRAAAEEIGWSPTDGALRTLASEYRNAGFFSAVSHGVVRLDRHRITSATGEVFDSSIEADDEISTDLDGEQSTGGPLIPDMKEPRGLGLDDGFDDDLPF